MLTPPVVIIGGLDPTGHAGVCVDVLVALAHDCTPHTVVTAQTMQTDTELLGYELCPVSTLEAALAQLNDRPIAAVKIGMLGSADACEAVAAWLRGRGRTNVVLDPVLAAGSGGCLADPNLGDAICRHLMPHVTFFTPNAREAEAFVGRDVTDLSEAQRAAEQLAEDGPQWVLVKGGHLEGAESVDVLAGEDRVVLLGNERIGLPRVRGTGCIMSTALACNLARGFDGIEAARRAKRVVTRAIQTSVDAGNGVRVTRFSVRLGRV